MPKLEYLRLSFDFHLPSDHMRRDLVHAPNVERVSLPTLYDLFFEGDSSYLEGLAALISVPHLSRLLARFLQVPSFPLLHLSELLCAAKEFRFPVASIKFSGRAVGKPNMAIYMADTERMLDRCPEFAPFQMVYSCYQPLGVQVAAAARICAGLAPMLEEDVERLHLDIDGFPFFQGNVERERWDDLLRPFRNVEKLQIDSDLMQDLSQALRPDLHNPDGGDGPPPVKKEVLLPNLCKLARPSHARFRDSFFRFIAVCHEAGQYIVKRRRPPISSSDDEEEDEEEEGKRKEKEGKRKEKKEKKRGRERRREKDTGWADEADDERMITGRCHVWGGWGSDLDLDLDYDSDQDSDSNSDPDSDSDLEADRP